MRQHLAGRKAGNEGRREGGKEAGQVRTLPGVVLSAWRNDWHQLMQLGATLLHRTICRHLSLHLEWRINQHRKWPIGYAVTKYWRDILKLLQEELKNYALLFHEKKL